MRKQLFTLSLFAGTLLLSTGVMNASTFYNVTVNTSTLAGTTGSIDFQFNPGVGSFQSATALINDFSGGTGGTQTIYGSGVSGGPANSPITITNTAGQDNEVLDTYTFGNSLNFSVNFSGPAITSPDGSNTAGSEFAFFIYSDPAGNNSALTSDPNGIAVSVSLSPEGTLSDNVPSTFAQVNNTPEPATFGLLALSLLAVAFLAIRRRVRA